MSLLVGWENIAKIIMDLIICKFYNVMHTLSCQPNIAQPLLQRLAIVQITCGVQASSFKVTKGCCWYNTTINKHLHLKKPFAQNLCENNLMFHWERSDYVLYIYLHPWCWIIIESPFFGHTHILNVTTMVLTLLFFFFVTFFLVFQKMGKFGIFFSLFLSSVNLTNFAKKEKWVSQNWSWITMFD